jgi:ribonuclease G
MYNEIRSYIASVDPEKVKLVKLYRGSVPIFDNFDISRQIKSLFARYVSLKRGAYLIIESTEAMNVIDVNSGNRTKADDNQEQHVLEVNLAAAAEIARQLRLRDLGGIVIIDFIDMHKAQSRQLLYDEMQRLMATDKARHTILPLTKFGLMQITRQRIRPVAVKDIQEVCPTCGGSGKIEPTVLLERTIENQLSLLAEEHGERYVNLVVSPYVAAFLKRGFVSLRTRWALRYGMFISITASQSAGIVEAKYLDRKGEDMLHPNYVGRRKPKKVAEVKVAPKGKESKAQKSQSEKSTKSRRRGKKSSETKG